MRPAARAGDFLSQRIGSDALTIAELIEQGAAKDERIAALEAILTPKQRQKLNPKKPEG